MRVGLDPAQRRAQPCEQGLGFGVTTSLLLGLTASVVEGLLLSVQTILQRSESAVPLDELLLV